MNLNVVHFHLIANHVPSVGLVVALSLLLVALAKRDEELKRITLALFFAIALVTLPVYISGSAADIAIKERPDISAANVRAHKDVALLAFALMGVVGAVAWLGLWQARRLSRLPQWTVAAVLVLSAVTLVLTARTATLGGEIRHPEMAGAAVTVSIVPAAEEPAAPEAGWLTTTAVALFVIRYSWVWQASETVHFIGMCLSIGIVLAVNLRILGMIKRVPFSALHRLLPLAVLGFGLNAVSGMLFFVAAPDQYTQNPSFFWKLAFILAAGVQVFYLTVFDKTWKLGPGDDAAITPKIVAASGLFLWFGIVFWGTMLPFLGLRFE
jgi:uncharacterized membrane protein